MKDYSRKFRIWECAALAALSLCLCAAAWAQSEQSRISGSLIRLHVVAASDSVPEQELKLRVRDEVLRCAGPLLRQAGSRQEALEILEKELRTIAEAAGRVSEGRSVSVSLGEESFPTRHYGSISLPAGKYCSLRVVLGPGQGRNWWCVVFPPLCLEAAQAAGVQSAANMELPCLLPEQGGYELRFKILEIWGEISNILTK